MTSSDDVVSSENLRILWVRFEGGTCGTLDEFRLKLPWKYPWKNGNFGTLRLVTSHGNSFWIFGCLFCFTSAGRKSCCQTS